jgi:putative ABC transport system substrate-binding protein
MIGRRTAATVVAALITQGICRAQRPAGVRIGRLSPLSPEGDEPHLHAFRGGLRDLGWIEGRDYVIEARFASGRLERLPELATQLLRQRVDLILAGSNDGAHAAVRATRTVPVIVVTTGDPVSGGLVKSLARPGGNLTGLTTLGEELIAKRLQLLKETLPGVERVAVLTHPGSGYTDAFVRQREALARALRIELTVVEAADPGRFEPAFAAAMRDRAGALMVFSAPLFISQRARLVELAARHALPALYPDRAFVDAGGLMFYGASLSGMYAQAAVYADRILKGALPADLPIEQAKSLELVINLKTATALRLAIPAAVLLKTDHVLR